MKKNMLNKINEYLDKDVLSPTMNYLRKGDFNCKGMHISPCSELMPNFIEYMIKQADDNVWESFKNALKGNEKTKYRIIAGTDRMFDTRYIHCYSIKSNGERIQQPTSEYIKENSGALFRLTYYTDGMFSTAWDSYLIFINTTEGRNFLSRSNNKLPSNITLSDEEIFKPNWLIHFTFNEKDALDIMKNGFKYGTKDLEKLAYTNNNVSKEDKLNGKLSYAYDAIEIGDGNFITNNIIKRQDWQFNNKFDQKAWERALQFAIMFIGNGIKAYHNTDREYQVIFNTETARNFVLLEYKANRDVTPDDRDTRAKQVNFSGNKLVGKPCWNVIGKNGKIVYYNNSLQKCVQWVIANYGQYHKALHEAYDYDYDEEEINTGNEIHYNNVYMSEDDENIIFTKIKNLNLFLSFPNLYSNPLSIYHCDIPIIQALKQVFNFDLSNFQDDMDVENLYRLVVGKSYTVDEYDGTMFGYTKEEFRAKINECTKIYSQLNYNTTSSIDGRVFSIDGKNIVTLWWLNDNITKADVVSIVNDLCKQYNFNESTIMIALPHMIVPFSQFLRLDINISVDDMEQILQSHALHNLDAKSKWEELSGWRDIRDNKIANKLTMHDKNGKKVGVMPLAQYNNLIHQENKKNSKSLLESEYGYHSGDLGKSHCDGLYGMSSSRNTGHYGSGTYFFGKKEDADDYGDFQKRPTHEINLDGYKLFRPKNYEDGMTLHNFLRQINTEYIYLPNILDTYDDMVKRFDIVFDIKRKYFGWDSSQKLTKQDFEHYIKVLEQFEGKSYFYKTSIFSFVQKKLSRGDWSREDILESVIDMVIENKADYFRQIKTKMEIEDKCYNELPRILGINYKTLLETLYNTWDYAKSHNYKRDSKEFKKTGKKSYLINSDIDSASTFFMKSLGFDGIDVRGIEGLDNGMYGSVIYDIK